MKRYVALLRGINVSGKNKIAMAELKKGFTELGYLEVSTYLNSGNVAFSSIEEQENIAGRIEKMIKDKFEWDIPVFVISQEELRDIVNHAPTWWGTEDKAVYDNLIFMLPPLSYERLYKELGTPKAELENVFPYKNSVFWSFDRTHYQKTNWWSKTASTGISEGITIRTANTVKKIMNL
ncbi:MAG: DUF1697 domain-containing protein [Lachnospiraceae bacterium]|nr:DUF1697 domain-containing protein [Lachnospiraceae bacterium]